MYSEGMNARFAALLLASSLPLMAQVRLSAGVKAGAPLTAITEGSSGSALIINRAFWWTLGPAVELDLPLGLGLEFDALFRRVGYEGPAGRAEFAGQRREFTGSVWDFPLLAKYRFTRNGVQPYVGGGWTYRRLGDLLRFSSGSSSNGGVISAGIRVGTRSIKISPEFRYTHWPNQDIQPGFRTRKSQFDALIGITF